MAEEVEDAVVIDYADIPNWGQSTVVGHAGKLVYGTLSGRKVLALQGRFHFYEGNPLEVVTFPVRVMKALGCEGVVVTNAAGGIGFGPGTLMAITDHINMTGQNPLIGENLDDFGPRFPDMSKAYTPEYRETAHKVADKLGIKLDDGVYIGVTGPTYETPAEIRAFKTLGADAVGMSTVPEVIIAAHSGLKVLGISCITNFAAGFQEELNHEEVVEVTERVKGDFKGLLKAILAELSLFLSFQLRTMREISLLYQPGGRRIWPARMFSFTQKASIRMLSGSWSPLFRSVMKSSIVEDLGSTGANTQKRPIQRPLTTNKSSRCRITVC